VQDLNSSSLSDLGAKQERDGIGKYEKYRNPIVVGFEVSFRKIAHFDGLLGMPEPVILSVAFPVADQPMSSEVVDNLARRAGTDISY
jgi:hypothetical protein